MTATQTPAAALRASELAFTSADEMPERTELPVRGELPSWLAGQLVRNGPGRWKDRKSVV